MEYLFAAGAAFAVLVAPPAGAAAQQTLQAGAPQFERDVEETKQFIAAINKALELSTRAMSERSPEMQRLLAGMTSPAAAKTRGPQVRALLGETRTKVDQAGAVLASLRPLNARISAGLGYDTAQIVADAKLQNDRVLELLGTIEDLVIGLETGNRAKMDAAAPRVMTGSFLLIEGQALIMRNRQATLPKTASTHQTVGISRTLYETMSAVARNWFAVRHEKKGAAAASALSRQLAATAQQARQLARDGRANAAREMKELAEAEKILGKGSAEGEMAAKGRLMLGEEEKLFVVADDLARWAEANRNVSAASLAAQDKPALLAALGVLETRLYEVQRRQAEIVTAE